MQKLLYLTVHPVSHSRTKQCSIDFHFVRERVAAGFILIPDRQCFPRASLHIVSSLCVTRVLASSQACGGRLDIGLITSNLGIGRTHCLSLMEKNSLCGIAT